MLRLTAEREAKGLSRNALAARAGITPADEGKIEARRMVPYDSQLRKLARALGMPEEQASSLMEEVEIDVGPRAANSEREIAKRIAVALEVESTLRRVRDLGYVDNQSAITLGIPVGTVLPSPDGR